MGVDGSDENNQSLLLQPEARGWSDHPTGPLAQGDSQKSEGEVSRASFRLRRRGEREEAFLPKGPGVPRGRAWVQAEKRQEGPLEWGNLPPTAALCLGQPPAPT